MYLHGAKGFLYPDDEFKFVICNLQFEIQNSQFEIRNSQFESPYPLMHPSGLSFATIFEIPALWHTMTTSCTFL